MTSRSSWPNADEGSFLRRLFLAKSETGGKVGNGVQNREWGAKSEMGCPTSRRICEKWESNTVLRRPQSFPLLPFPTMLRIRPGLRKIRIGIFDHRILVAMPKLLLQPHISLWLVMLRFTRTFLRILINFIIWHDRTPL